MIDGKSVLVGRRWTGVAFLLLGSAAAVACAGDDGAAGAAGAPGAPGPAGSAGAAGGAGAAGPPGASADAGEPSATGQASALYTQSNDATLNEILAYSRGSDGTLTTLGSFATGGRGTGTGLGDQGALVLDSAKGRLFAVNAGDDSISMFRVHDDGSLALLGKASSGGTTPIGVTLHGDTLYVVNRGDVTHPAQIAGFTAGETLVPIPGSTHPLSIPLPNPAQIQFTPDGTLLVVTEKDTNKIDTYVVTAGVAGAAKTASSSGTTPFGFDITAGNKVVVSEAFGGGATLGATSTYSVTTDGTLAAVSPSVTSTQTAPCWVTIVGSDAYVANTGSNTLSHYRLAADAMLTLVDSSATTGEKPADITVTTDKAFLYSRNGGDGTISIFALGGDGALTKKSALGGLPLAGAGLVTR